MSININYAAWENSLKLTWSKKETVVCEASFYFKNLKFTLLKYFSLSLFRLYCKDYRNNFARASRFFIHFFAVTRRLRRELPNFTFHRQRKHTKTNFSFSFQTWIYSRKVCLHWTKWASWDNRTEVSKNAKPIFQGGFRRQSRRGILNSL